MEEVILFLLSFILVFVLYQLFIVGRAKRNYKKGKKKDPVEVVYLSKVYKLDMEKIQYNQLLQIISLVSSFDIALIVAIILLFDKFILELLVGFVSTLVIIFISYYFIYLFYKKKGMVKHE